MASDEKELLLPEMLDALSSKKFIFVGGKGGVGKTTVSSMVAVGLAKERGKKVLLISTDPAHSVSDSLEQKLSGVAQQVQGVENLWAVETDPTMSVESWIGNSEQTGNSSSSSSLNASSGTSPDLMEQLKQMMTQMKDWLSSLPGIDEAVALMHILENESGIQGNKYDCVVLDTAPTGHTLKLLNLPSVLDQGIEKLQSWQTKLASYISMATMFFSRPQDGVQTKSPTDQLAEKLEKLKENVIKLKELFTDAKSTTFICVAIAESMSVQETSRLLTSLKASKVHSEFLVVNKLYTKAFLVDDPGTEVSGGANDHDGGTEEPKAKVRKVDDPRATLREKALLLCMSRAKIQSRYVKLLAEEHASTHRLLQIQEQEFEPTGIPQLEKLISMCSSSSS